MELLITGIIFAISLAVLIKASEYFTKSSEKIGVGLGIPSFIVGVTIVSIGTSLPELATSVLAVLEGSTEIVVGNVIGSNITNIFLVLGIAAIMDKNLKITYELIHVDLPLLVGSTFMLAVAIWDGVFTITEGVVFIGGILLYLYYTYKTQEERGKKEKTKKENNYKIESKTIFILVLSAIMIYFGAKYTLESLIEISVVLNIGKEIIAASAVALGTSLPELIVSVTAAKRGNAEMAVGNVLGSNIFNSFAVMGIPALIGTLVIPESIISFGLPMLVIATLLYHFVAQDRWITKWEGYMLVLFYILYIGKLFGFI